MKIKNLLPLLFLSAFFFYSCNTAKDKQVSDIKVADLNEIIETAGAINPEVTSITYVFKTLDLVDAKYYPVLCNDPFNAKKYKKNKAVAAANLGVFIGDIVYHMYGEATKDMFLSFSASQELARYIGIDSDFGAALLTELEGGKISRDSLITAFNDLMIKSENYTATEEIMHLHTAFLSGLYFEKLFITSSLINQLQKQSNPTPKNIESFKELFIIFSKQLSTLSVLSGSLDNYQDELSSIFDYEDIKNLMISEIALGQSADEIIKTDKLRVFDSLSIIHKQISKIRTEILSAG